MYTDYVDNYLVGTGKASEGAIIGSVGEIWAASSGFSIKTEEAEAIISGFQNASYILNNGAFINGIKYVVSQTDHNLILSKGKSGFFIAKTSQTIVLGMFNASTPFAQCVLAVKNVADFISRTGY